MVTVFTTYCLRFLAKDTFYTLLTLWISFRDAEIIYLHIASNIKNLGGGKRIINVWMFKAHGVSLKVDSPAAVWIRLSIEHTLNAALFMHITASRRCVMLKCTNINLDSKYGNNYNEH